MSLDKDVEKVLAMDLGPSAPSFLIRQCESHLGKTTENLTEADLEELAKWCYVSVKLILGEAIAEKIKEGILKLI